MAELFVQRIAGFETPELRPYATLKRPQAHEENGIFVAEGTKVVRRLLESSFQVVSAVLPDAYAGEFLPLLQARSERAIPVYLADQAMLEQLVGFPMFQGVMAVGRIPQPESLDSILAHARPPRLLAALDALNNAENLGALVRSAVGLHAQALIVGETSASPFMRRSVRASMGAIFQIPVAQVAHLAQSLLELRRLGIRCLAAHPHAEGRTLPQIDLRGDTCIVFGSEGTGIRPAVLAACDVSVAVPMPPSVDSLNVGSAAAIFLYEVNRQRGLYEQPACKP